jgi:hypothetical protein
LRAYDLMCEFSVHCPQCNGHAKVTLPIPFDYKNGLLKCLSCHFSEKAVTLVRYHLTGKAKCYQCLEFLDFSLIEGFKNIPSYVNIICNYCDTVNKIKENWESYVAKYHESGIVDPAFGLPLWFQDSVKGNIIWAYNLRHLTEIKNYVRSTLRERTTDRFKMTMVEKLPEFIKLANNRDEVLKAVNRMLQCQ